MKRFIAPLFLALLAFGAFVLVASAHAKLDHCNPTPGTAISDAPKEVRCWFTEEIDDKQSTLTVTDASGGRVDNNDGKVDLNDADHQQMFATLKTLPSGVYKVTWHTVTTDDQGVSDGTWYFGVGQVSVPTYVPPTEVAQAGTPSASGSTTPAASTTTGATPAGPAVAPTLAVLPPTSPSSTAATGIPDQTVVIAVGVAEALVIIGVLVFLYRSTH